MIRWVIISAQPPAYPVDTPRIRAPTIAMVTPRKPTRIDFPSAPDHPTEYIPAQIIGTKKGVRCWVAEAHPHKSFQLVHE